MTESSEPTRETDAAGPDRQVQVRIRQKILLSLLGLAVLALGYDFLIARRGVASAYQKVEEANAATNTSLRTRLTNADVQKLLERPPSETYEEGPYTVELYAWTAGLPVGINGAAARSPGFGRRTHDYYALYAKSGPDLIFQTHYKFNMDGAEQPAAATAGGSDFAEDMLLGDTEPLVVQPDGGGIDPAAIFAQQDKNEDGKLTRDELSDRVAANFDLFDMDHSGELSPDEFDDGMRTMFPAGAPGGF